MVLATRATPVSVIWHDLECGGYRADLELWRELADASQSPGTAVPLLDVGAGSGRVTLDLIRAGHRVTAIDLDGELLDALLRRAGPRAPETIRADARSLELARRDHALCLVPMQTIQLLGGESGRGAFLRRAREHLRPGGLLACAIVTDLEPFDCAGAEIGPTPETVRVDGVTYISSAVRVAIDRHTIEIERERRVVPAAAAGRSAEQTLERNVIGLDRLSAARLRREGRRVGLQPAGTRTIAATDEYVGSEVVLLRA